MTNKAGYPQVANRSPRSLVVTDGPTDGPKGRTIKYSIFFLIFLGKLIHFLESKLDYKHQPD